LQVENKDLTEKLSIQKKQKSDDEKKSFKTRQDSIPITTEYSSTSQHLERTRKNEGERTTLRKETLEKYQSEAFPESLAMIEDIEKQTQFQKDERNNENHTDRKKEKMLSSTSINQFSIVDIEQKTLNKQKSSEKFSPQNNKKSFSPKSNQKSDSKNGSKAFQQDLSPSRILQKTNSNVFKNNLRTTTPSEQFQEATKEVKVAEISVETNTKISTEGDGKEKNKPGTPLKTEQIVNLIRLKGSPLKTLLFKNDTLQSEENEDMKIYNAFQAKDKINFAKRKKSLLPHQREISRICITERKDSGDFPFLALANFSNKTYNLQNIKSNKLNTSVEDSNQEFERNIQKISNGELQNSWMGKNYWNVYAKIESRKIFNGLNSQYKLDLSKSQARLAELSELSANQEGKSLTERGKLKIKTLPTSHQMFTNRDNVLLQANDSSYLKKASLRFVKKVNGNLDHKEGLEVKYLYECLIQSPINMQIFVTWVKEIIESKNYKVSEDHLISRDEVEVQLIEALHSFERFLDFYLKCKNIHQSCGPICVHLAKFRERIKVMISHKVNIKQKK